MLEVNLEYIREHIPDFEKVMADVQYSDDLSVITAQNGSPSIEIGKKLLHSKFDPEAEAAKFIDSILIRKDAIPVFVGLGLGYHIEELLKRYSDFETIIIIEPRLDIIKAALDTRNLKIILEQKNLNFIYSKSEDKILAYISKLTNDESIRKKLFFIVHTPSLSIYEQNYRKLIDTVKRFSISPKLQQLMQKNFEDNLHFTMHSPGIIQLFNKFENKPIVLVSAGPSLVNDIEHLKKVQDNVLIICVSTALKLLLKNNIKPDIVAIADSKKIMLNHFEEYLDEQIPLLFVPTASNSVLKNYKGPKIVALQNDYRLCKMVSDKVDKGSVDVGESVATLILDVGIKLGGDPIIFVGQDLAFSDGHSHAAGIEKRLKVEKDFSTVENVKDEIVSTSSVLLWFKDWIEKRIEKTPNRTYINASQSGARITGTTEMRLENAVEKYCKDKLSKVNLNSLFK